MPKEMISTKQIIFIICMFLFGSTGIIGGSNDAEQDSWITIILGALMSLPMVFIYARILKLFPEKSLFDIIQQLFGKIFGKIIIIIMTFYALHLGSLVLRNFSEFIKVVSIPETPEIVCMIGMILVVAYLVRSGVGTLGKWSTIFFIYIIAVILFTVIFSFRYYDYSNMLPFMNHKWNIIFNNSFLSFSFPFAETVLFMVLACSFKKSNNPYKSYVFGILIGATALLIINFRNLFILGSELVKSNYFPSYVAVRIIELGDFLTRMEGTIAINFILAGITKAAVCLFAASIGFARIFEIKNYKKMVWPVGLLMLALCSIIYTDITQMFDFIKIYPYYAIPFQIIIPIVVWITAEIKTHKINKNQAPQIA